MKDLGDSNIADSCPPGAATCGRSKPARVGLRLQAYGIRVGLQLVRHRKLRRGLRYLIVPVNYWRSIEYRMALEEGVFMPGERILDIGSPKLLALWLAENAGVSVVATDIEAYFTAEYGLLGTLRGVTPGNLKLAVEDGRGLTFAAASFDKVYSISVLEHIPNDGDIQCVREIARVLAPGGRCVLTVPFWPESRVDWRRPDFYWSQASVGGEAGKVFFQRRYSEPDIEERLVYPSGLRPVKLRYVGEKIMAASRREFCELLPPLTGPVQPLLANLLLTSPVDDWRRLRKPLCALVVLEKQAENSR